MTVDTDQQFRDYAIRSYRYLRLAIVVMVLSLGASVIIERSDAACWQGSISAYFYTPARSMFVGALVTIAMRHTPIATSALTNIERAGV